MLIILNINKDYLYFLFFLIINFILNLIQKNYTDFYKKNFNFMFGLSQLCLIIFYFWEKYITKEMKKKFHQLKKNKNKITKNFLIAFSIIFFVIYSYIEFNFKSNLNILERYITISLLLILIDFIFFKKHFYSHHIISINVNIFLIIYCIITKKKYVLNDIFFIIKYYSYSFSFLLIKYINTIYFINIFLLGSLSGISFLVQYFIHNHYEIFITINQYYFFYVMIFFIIVLIQVFLYCIIILKLGVIHAFIIDSLSNFILLSFGLSKINIIEIIIIGLSIISCLIYLEIIELNFCDLNHNIKNNIGKRAINEIKNEVESFNNSSILISEIFQ
jgi:hypothetical protein